MLLTSSTKKLPMQTAVSKTVTSPLRIIHALPTSLFSLQIILLENAPPSDRTDWDLQALCQRVTSAEDRARAAGLKLGTKVDNLSDPKVLTTRDDPRKGKRKG